MVMGGEASKISQSMPVKSSFSSWHFMKWDSWWWVTPGPVGSYRNHQAAPPTVAAPTYPPIAMYLKNSHLEIRGSLGERGGLPMMSRSGGLKPRAVAGRPSVTRLTHSSWTGIRASGRPRAAVRKIQTTSPTLEEMR